MNPIMKIMNISNFEQCVMSLKLWTHDTNNLQHYFSGIYCDIDHRNTVFSFWIILYNKVSNSTHLTLLGLWENCISGSRLHGLVHEEEP